MKKIMVCLLVLGLLNVAVSATAAPRETYKKVCSFDELIWWIQSEEAEMFFDGEFKDNILRIRNDKEFLMPKEHNGFTHAIISFVSPSKESITYYHKIDGKRVEISIGKSDENVLWTEENVRQYFQQPYAVVGFLEKDKLISFGGIETANCVVFNYNVSKNSNHIIVGFFEADNIVTISMRPDEFDIDIVKDFSFQYVSLSESVELGYTDVAETDWHYEDVKYATFNEYILGTSETTFSPNTPADRVTIASALYNTQGELSYTRAPDFVDVDENDPYATAIWWAQSNGIVNGVGDNKFNPYGYVTRQDFAVMLWRYMKYKKFELPPIENAKVFADDGEIADYAKEAVKTLNVLEIMNGKGNDKIDPRGNVTRAEAAAMLHRMMNKMK